MAPIDQEQLEFQHQVEKIKLWWSSPRFESVKRPYSAESIVSKQGTLMTTYRSNTQAQKLWTLLKLNKHTKNTSYTFSALDPIKTVHQQLVYVSGTLIDTLPDKVDHLFRTQLFHDRKQREERLAMESHKRKKIANIDYLKPIVVNMVYGGTISIMKCTKMLVERGAAGIHVEDQQSTPKECQDIAGKVIIPTSEYINHLVAVRAQCDIMGVETLIIAQTNAESATHITSNIDPRDHPFILGTTNPTLEPLSKVLLEAESKGIQGSALQQVQDKWIENADLKCYSRAVVEELVRNNNADVIDDFLNDIRSKSNEESRLIAKEKYGVLVFWDWNIPRDRNGFFCYKGGIETATARSVDCTDYADMLWMETKRPTLQQAQKFARYVLAANPQALLCYNISPSFNWHTDKSKDGDIRSYMDQLTKCGYVWQFFTLDGIHSRVLAAGMDYSIYRDLKGEYLFSRYFTKWDMYNHTPRCQCKGENCYADILQHQRWPDANYMDKSMGLVTGNLFSYMAKEGTEEQFK